MHVPKPNPRLSLKNILFTTDFSSASDMALPYALALARWYGAKVLVAHAVPPEPMLGVPMDPAPVEMDFNWQAAQRKMAEFVRSGTFRDTPHEQVLRQGELWDVLSAILQQHEIDLLVLGTHGRDGLKKLLLGSAAEQIFRRAFCPVLTVGPRVPRQPAPFENWKRILFATDFSEGSLNALPYALSLAEENQACLILLHLIPLAPVQEQEVVMQSARRRLEALVPLEAAAWCKPEFVVRFEFPAQGILQVAQERGCDLVVMGVHGSATPRAATHLPWATAHDVVCHAHCPVLTVRG